MSGVDPGRAIFISYARDDDEPFARRLWQYLAEQGFKVWWDREAMESRGRTFLREIRDAISSSERLLLIVGPAVRDRKYVDVEWRHALRVGTVVTPVLRLGDYHHVPDALRALHCEDVRASIPERKALGNVARIAATPIPKPAPVPSVPRLPTPLLEREELLDQLRSRVLIDSYQPIDLEPDQRITSMTGMGGAGKSVLAAALAQSFDVRRSFPSGIHWIAVGRGADTLSTLTRIGLAVGDSAIDRYSGVPEARLLLSRTLSSMNCLIVLDDVWEVGVAEALHTAAGSGVRILLTGRKRNLFASAGVHEVRVDELTDAEALGFLAAWTDTPPDELPPEAAVIAGECGNLPLALAMIGGTIRGRPDRWRHMLERLRAADLAKIGRRLPDYTYETLDRAMLVGFEDLSDSERERYLDFAALPEDVAAPGPMFVSWWGHEGVPELDATDLLDAFVDRSLLRIDDAGLYSIHDVQHDFLKMRVPDQRSLHDRWVRAHRARLADSWASASDDGYFWDHLAHHLKGAGREAEWRSVLASFDWIEHKTILRGFPAVLLDLAAYADDARLGPLHRSCRRIAHVLINDPSQLAAQLLARLKPGTKELDPLLEAAREWSGRRWLRPATASLDEAGEPTIAVFRGREADGHAGTPRGLAISADNTLVASAGGSSNDLTVKVWSTAGAGLLQSLEGVIEAGQTTALAFVSDAGHVAVAGCRDVRVYALDAKEPIARLDIATADVTRICAGAAPGVLLVSQSDGAVIEWNSRADNVRQLREPDGNAVCSLAVAPAASQFVCATRSKLEVRSLQNGSLIATVDVDVQGVMPFQPPPLVITADGRMVYFGSDARAWSVGEATTTPGHLQEEPESAVDFSADGATILALAGGRLTAARAADGKRIISIDNSREFSYALISPDGHVAVTADYEHDVKLWDLKRPASGRAPWIERGRVRKVAICDDPTLAFVACENVVEIWYTTQPAAIGESVETVASKPQRRSEPLLDPWRERQIRERLAAAVTGPGDDGEMPPQIAVATLAFSHAAGRVVSAPARSAKFADVEEPAYVPDQRQGYPLSLWNLNDVSEPRVLHGHTSMIMCADITTDGKHALTGSWGRVLRLWDLDAGACVNELRGHRGIVVGCAITDDATLAVSGSEDMTVRLWDLVQGRLLFTFATASGVLSCDIARDGSVAIAGEVSGRVHVFHVR